MMTVAADVAPFAEVLKEDVRIPFAEVFDFDAEGMAHPVLVAGDGPGVILMHEMPGFIPEFWRLAHWIKDAGFRVYLPAFFEKPDTPVEKLVKPLGLAKAGFRACVSREIRLFVRHGGSPISIWLRALARHVHAEQGGPGVGVMGLCMTGNFAWSVAVDPSVIAAVAGEPSLPIATNKAGLHLESEEAEALGSRESLKVIARRFENDPVCRPERFAALEQLLGERVDADAFGDEAQNPDGLRWPHAVFTKDLIPKPGEPTFEATRKVLSFFTERLRG